MGYLADIIGKNAPTATKVLVDRGLHSFEIGTDKALTQDQIAALGIENLPTGANAGTVWPTKMANTIIDAHNERFTREVLQVYANQINQKGITFNFAHDREQGVGRVLKKAEVVPMGDGSNYELRSYVWVINAAKYESGITINAAIETEIYKEVSVEVSGTVRYIDGSNGNSGFWEYYVDTERPDRSRITGLALVQVGAQVETSIKSIDGNGANPQREKSNSENMQFDKEYEAGGKSHRIYTEKAADGSITLKGVNEAIEAHKAAEIAKAEAVTAKATAEAELATAKSELAEARKAYEADLVNYSKLNGKAEPTAEAIKAMTVVALKAASEAEKAAHDAAQGSTKTDAKTVFSDVKTAVKGMNF